VGAGGYGGPAGGGGYRTDGAGPQPSYHQFTISATNGGNSTFGSLTAIGGGYGGSSYYGYTPNNGYGNTGGSGGGASGYSDGNTGRGGAGTYGQGYAGGGGGGQYYSGGGGGAGGAGGGGGGQANGGPGILNPILGADYYWGGGGGGAAYSLSTGGNGGIGGGGGGAVGTTTGGIGYNTGNPGGGGSPGSQTNKPGGDAGANTGGGGGGGSHYNLTNKGGEGGSGIVIVKFSSSQGSALVSNGIFLDKTGLILHLDAFNKKSNFLNTKNLIDFTTWTPGTNTTTWPSNGDGAQNSLIYDTDPWGNSSLVLKTIPNNPYANGGWEGCSPGYWVNADRNKKYRSCVWVRRISANTNGTFYHGLHTDGTGDVVQSDGTTNGNPYWACQGIGYLTQNQWYLHVGHIFPYNSTPAIDPTSGYWTRSGGWSANPGCNITGYDPRFPSDATLLRNRVYHYYASSDANSNLEFLYPRIDLCDGTEPSIADILNNSPTTWYDSSGYGNHFNMQGNITFDSTYGYTNFGGNSTGSGNKFYRSSFPTNLKTSQLGSGYTVMVLARSTGGSGAWRKLIGNADGDNYIDLYQSPGAYWHQDGSGDTLYYNAGIGVANDTFVMNDSVMRLYIATNSNSGTLTNPAAALAIGNEPSSNAYPWVGNIVMVSIYNRVLSTDEMIRAFNAIRGRYGI
jgi:hypothetical protein